MNDSCNQQPDDAKSTEEMTSASVEPPNDPRSLEEIIAAAIDETDDDRYCELRRVLKYRGTRDTLEAMRALTQNINPDARVLGVDVLGEFGLPDRAFPDEVKEIILDLLRHETDPDVVASICYAVGFNPEWRIIDPLVKLKSHPNRDVREAVAHGLLTQEDDAAVRTLIELSSDPDDEVRNWATFGLGWTMDLDTPEIREALRNRLDDNFDAVRGEALRGFAKRQDERVIEPLIRELYSIAEAEEWWDYAFDAVELMPDPRLYPALMAMWNSGFESSTLDHAIALCRIPSPEEDRKPSNAPTSCPVCGRRRAFRKPDDWEFCKRCGWENGQDERDDPDLKNTWTNRSLNDERERWRVRIEAGKQQSNSV